MRYDHDVKFDGKWYKAGEDVPALNTTKVDNKVAKVDEEPKEVESNPQEAPKKYVRNRK